MTWVYQPLPLAQASDVAFDAALMAAMNRPWPDIVFGNPEVVASGSVPPSVLPS